ncbi:MAG TPA: maleylpyruvate isomerase N-terminal domain-containing protein [Acidimicrobiales bacterium]
MQDRDFDAFKEASQYFVEVVGAVPSTSWDLPGLGEWTIKELVGHTNRANVIIVDYLERPQRAEPADSTYFTDENIAQRGRDAVEQLGDDPYAAVAAASERAIALVQRTPSGAAVGSPMGTMKLSDYLPSRTAELTIHGLDLARALNLELVAPSEALRASLAYVAGFSMRRNQGETVLFALSGRGELPSGFNVYWPPTFNGVGATPRV